MSSSEPADDITAPRDPASYARPRSRSGLPVWALTALCVLCLLAGAAIAWFVPRMFAPAARPPAAVAAPAAAPVQIEPSPPPPAPPPAAPTSAELEALQLRVQQLETAQDRSAEIAAGALAAAALADASQGSRPFAGELAMLERALPLSADLRELRRLAETGAPTRAALIAGFEPAAARAAAAAHEPDEKAGPIARLLHALSRIVSIRRVDDANGSGPDAILARAEGQVAAGDLEGALKTLAALPPRARQAMADWQGRAQARVEIDRRVAGVREAALVQLLAAAGRR